MINYSISFFFLWKGGNIYFFENWKERKKSLFKIYLFIYLSIYLF